MVTTCTINKQDSNFSGLSFAEEVCLGILPSIAAGDPAEATWYGLEPNSYADFGGELITVARSPIEPTRQNSKGTVVDLNASGGFNNDLTLRNLPRLAQGFYFADILEKPSTAPINGTAINLGAVTGATKKYATGTTAVAFNKAGYIILASGFGIAANNGIKTVVSADVDDVTVNEVIADEADGAVSKIEVVGYEFATADASIDVTGNVLQLKSAANVLATLGLSVGEWIFVGGDTLASDRFANNVGYGRISVITAGAITLDDCTWTGVDEVSTGKKIRIFFGSFLRNSPTSAGIKRRSYNLERTLGNGPTTTQAEYLEGAVANEMKVNIPGANKLTLDFGFVAADFSHRSGEAADEIKVGTRIAAVGEDAFNSTSDIYRQKLSLVDITNSNPSALFGYITEGNITISNGVTPNKAVGVLGAFDTSAGNFVVSGSLTAYFTTVAAVRAVRNNSDAGYNIIAAKANVGSIFDIPLLGLGGGRVSVEKDQPIKVPVTPAAAKNRFGFTSSYNFFAYLPNVAMPQ